MKDKEKQIEEMAKDLNEFFDNTPMELSFKHKDGKSDIITDNKALKVLDAITRQALIPCFVECLTDLGYRKLPENSVVISSEQYINYLITQTNCEWLKEKVEKLQADNERLYKNLGKFKETVSKETAEKIYLQAKAIVNATKHYVQGREYLHIDALKEIVKQFGVEIKE